MNDKGLGIAIAIGIIFFSLMWAQTNGFASSPVASSDVTVQDSPPTVNDDITRGYLPGYVWVDQTGLTTYMAISTDDGAASWDALAGSTASASDLGELSATAAASAAQVLTTAGTYYVVEELNIAGVSIGTTVDPVAHDIEIASSGDYEINYSFSFSGTANSTVEFKVFIDNVAVDTMHVIRKVGTGGDIGTAGFSGGIIELTAGDIIDVRMTSDGNGDSVTIETGVLTLFEIL